MPTVPGAGGMATHCRALGTSRADTPVGPYAVSALQHALWISGKFLETGA